MRSATPDTVDGSGITLVSICPRTSTSMILSATLPVAVCRVDGCACTSPSSSTAVLNPAPTIVDGPDCKSCEIRLVSISRSATPVTRDCSLSSSILNGPLRSSFSIARTLESVTAVARTSPPTKSTGSIVVWNVVHSLPVVLNATTW